MPVDRRMSDAAHDFTVQERPPKDQRRQEMLDAAFVEFSEKGYNGTSMEAIARRARASKETLYSWFTNKETLFNTLVADRLDRLTNRVVPAAAKDPSPAHLLPVIAEDIIRLVLTMTPLTSAAGGGNTTAARAFGRAITDERKNFVNYLLWCREQGYIAFDDDPFEITSLFVAMAQGEWVLRLGTEMIGEITEQMIAEHAQLVTRVFLKGLAPEKG